MAITAAMVKELRELSGAGMMDCKKALTNTDGDIEKAMEFLRENGLAKAAKKAGRIAAEGIVSVNVSEDGKTASMVEVNSETDFVAKNEVFRDFVVEVAVQAVQTEAADIDAFWLSLGRLYKHYSKREACRNDWLKSGENMNIRRFVKLNQSTVLSYLI